MLDIKWIINNPEEADKSFKRRGLDPLANKLIKMSKSRSEAFIKLENLLEQRNNLSKEIPNISNKSKKNEVIKKVKVLKSDNSLRLKARVLRQEHKLYPLAIYKFISNL